jgi:hypothetical protein
MKKHLYFEHRVNFKSTFNYESSVSLISSEIQCFYFITSTKHLHPTIRLLMISEQYLGSASAQRRMQCEIHCYSGLGHTRTETMQ